jgi:hypothetical protein
MQVYIDVYVCMYVCMYGFMHSFMYVRATLFQRPHAYMRQRMHDALYRLMVASTAVDILVPLTATPWTSPSGAPRFTKGSPEVGWSLVRGPFFGDIRPRDGGGAEVRNTSSCIKVHYARIKFSVRMHACMHECMIHGSIK